jgi:hypothetical protein
VLLVKRGGRSGGIEWGANGPSTLPPLLLRTSPIQSSHPPSRFAFLLLLPPSPSGSIVHGDDGGGKGVHVNAAGIAPRVAPCPMGRLLTSQKSPPPLPSPNQTHSPIWSRVTAFAANIAKWGRREGRCDVSGGDDELGRRRNGGL